MSPPLNSSIKSHRLVYATFLSAIIIWCMLILLAPLLGKFDHRFSSGLIYLFFSKICHQIPERSFFIFGKQLVVCSRCAGIYFGFLMGAMIYPIAFKLNHKRELSPKYLLWASVPIAVDVLIRIFHLAENTFVSRSVTGLILGAVTALVLIPTLLSIEFKNTVQNF